VEIKGVKKPTIEFFQFLYQMNDYF